MDKETGSWDWICCYYDFGEFSELTRAEALFKALDYYLMRTNEKHIPWARMSEIADAVELSDTEAEYLGLDMRQYRATIGENADDPAAPFSAGGDYGPADPWDAPGMSISDFL